MEKNKSKNQNSTQNALMITPDLCIGCRACQVACKEWNNLPSESSTNQGTYENPPDLSGALYNRIMFIEIPSKNGMKWVFSSQRCMHCTEAACLKACPMTGAIYKSPEGAVLFNKEICTGNFKSDRRECADACPFKVVRFDKDGKISKCNFCYDRITEGLKPACAKTCPTGAIDYDARKTLIANAKAQGFTTIYGEKELGGLNVLYALKESPTIYKLPEKPTIPENLSAYYSRRELFRLFT